MRTRECPATRLCVEHEPAWQDGLEVERDLPVPELADVEVASLVVEAAISPHPAEEDVARRLHQPLPLDDALAVMAELALPQVRLEHGNLRLLDLEEQRVVVVAAEQQDDPRSCPDAADADDLPRDVDEAIALEQLPAVVLEGAAVLAEHRGQLFFHLRRARVVDEL